MRRSARATTYPSSSWMTSCGSTGTPQTACRTRRSDSPADSDRASANRTAWRSRGAPRLGCRARSHRRSSEQSPECRALSTRTTRSRSARSRAQASSVSAGDATANPRSRVALGGTLWRTTCSPRRRGRDSSRETAMKKGGSAGVLGSHHPRNAAALRWVITADLGRTNCQAAAREASEPAAESGR